MNDRDSENDTLTTNQRSQQSSKQGPKNINTFLEERKSLLQEIDAIQAQVDKSDLRKLESGELADRIWYKKATHSLKRKRQSMNTLNHYISNLKRLEKSSREKEWYCTFVKVARSKLPKDVFVSIRDEVDQQMGMGGQTYES